MAKAKKKKKKSAIGSYVRFINTRPGVKAANRRLKKLESQMNAVKRKKKSAVAKAAKAYKRKRK